MIVNSRFETLEPRRLLNGDLPVFEVNINASDLNQEIVGFGSSMIDWYSVESYADPEFYNDIANDLGATVVRVPVPQDFERYNDNDDPNVANVDGFQTRELATSMEYVQELEKRVDHTVLASVWSPPFWMKTNFDSHGGGGHLRPEMRGEFAEYLAEYVIASQREFGVTIDVVSLQNEPLLTEPYGNSLYSPFQLAETFVTVRDHFDSVGLSETKLMVAEDLNFNRRFEVWSDALQDAYARRNRDLPEGLVWGTHWSNAYDGNVWEDVAKQTDRQVWSTESAGKGTSSMSGGLTFLEEAIEYLERGGLSSHIVWQSDGNGGSSWYLRNNDGLFKTGTYAATKHIARWIRPGSHILETRLENSRGSDNGYGRGVGFVTPDGDYGAVLSNRSSGSREVTINFTTDDGPGAAANWKAFLSLESDGYNADVWTRRADAAGTGEVPLTVAPDGSSVTLTLPARSMLTLSTAESDTIDDAQTATTARRSLAVAVPRGVQRLSYFHEVLAVGWIEGIQNEISDQRASLVWGETNRGLLHGAGAVMIGDVPTAMSYVYDVADRLNLDYNRQDMIGMTPLMVASATQMSGLYYAFQGQYVLVDPQAAADRVEQYVLRGADLHAKDDLGRTALHWASTTPRLAVTDTVQHQSYNVPMLLSLGADVNKVDATGRTALDWATEEGNIAHAAALAAWSTDTAAPELLSAEGTMTAFVGATLTFDETVGPLTASDFVLVRDDGLTASAELLSVTTLAGGNTQVQFAAADRLRLPAGHWRVYPVEGGAADVAGNGYVAPSLTRGRNVPGFAEIGYNPADANGDGTVNLSDFAILRGNMNSAQTQAGGDFNGDGWVNLLDFAILRRDFGTNLNNGPAGDFGGRVGSQRTVPFGDNVIVDELPATSGTFAVPTPFESPTSVLTGDRSFFDIEAEEESIFARR